MRRDFSWFLFFLLCFINFRRLDAEYFGMCVLLGNRVFIGALWFHLIVPSLGSTHSFSVSSGYLHFTEDQFIPHAILPHNSTFKLRLFPAGGKIQKPSFERSVCLSKDLNANTWLYNEQRSPSIFKHRLKCKHFVCIT